MRIQKVLGLTMVLILLLGASPALACGDKLLVLGQGARLQIAPSYFPGNIIFFMNPNTPGASEWKDTEFQKIMREAGHNWKSVRSREQLEAELKSQRYHVIIADFADAPGLEALKKTLSSEAVILPWVYAEPGASKAEFKKTKAAAMLRYSYVLERATVKKVMSNVEKSMARAYRHLNAGMQL